ncbi:MAG: hypothetical protein JXM70_13035 [Pirellulales bacterium]|nr:hypothetical protein [Pirellulales bacterium]
MYEEHPTFPQPNNEEVKVWRYLDFTKFVSLIESRRLYFARADKFDDPFEGSWPKINVEAREIALQDISPEAKDKYLQAMRQIGEINKKWPRYTAINCWHMNEYESAAMWKLYLKSDEGIAIQSTYAKLKKSIIDDEKVYIGKVKYIDYKSEFIDASNILGPFVHKRKSFAHEQEIRALITKWPTREKGLDFEQETIDHGIEIRIDIETLIEHVYIAPSAPAWFAGLVKAVTTKYGYSFEILHSNLKENPIF